MLRSAAAILVFFPWLLWLQKSSLATKFESRNVTLKHSLPWLIMGIVLATLCYTEWYIPSDSNPELPKQGPAYIFVSITMIAAFAFLAGQSWYEMRRQTGIRKVEMQFLVFNSSIAALIAMGLGLFSHSLEAPILRRLGHLVVIGVYAMAGWAVTYYRVYDIKQVITTLLQRVGLVAILTCGIYLGWIVTSYVVPQAAALIISASIFCSIAFFIDRRSRAWLGIDGERELEKMRRDVINLARTQPHPELLCTEFEGFLREHCGTSSATLLLVEQDEAYTSDKLEYDKNRPGHTALCESGWATPESLERRRPTVGLSDLQAYLFEQSLGLIVAAPRGSPSPTLIIAFGTKLNEWPFTYPEVVRLQNIAELMDNILTRSRLTMQAAIQAKLEHLAMMSRGLAHDLNNLITPVSSFLVYTDQRFPSGTPEREVHDAAKRSVRVMGDYVREALFFSDRLTPRFEPLEPDRIFEEVCGLMASRAAERGVTLTRANNCEGPVFADAVLLQRVMANVVGNAIDASSRGQNVHLSAMRGRSGWFCLQVTDEGCGIAPEHIQQIFDPYFTTKKYGEEVRGFGLGLTICQKIVHLHNGAISVKSQPGRGTTLTIDLPVVQKSQPHPNTAQAKTSPGPVFATPLLKP